MTGADLSTRIARAQLLADLTVEQRHLEPPVDVESLLAEHTTVKRVQIDARYDVDAFIHGLGDEYGSVVVLNEQRPPRRIRFTLGHELGHVLVPWHLGNIACTLDEDTTPADNGSAVMGTELEADAFAARLLLPKRYIARYVDAGVPALLKAAEAAELSLRATLRSLAALLPPGYVFALLDNTGRQVVSHYRSPRTTSLSLVKGRRLDRERMQQLVGDEGLDLLDSRQVWWARTNRAVAVGDGTDDWRTLFEQILRDAGFDGSPSGSDWGKIVAVAGHAYGTVKDGSVEAIAGAIDLGYRKRADLRAVWAHPRFAEFVKARSRAFVAAPPRRRTKKR